MPIDLPPRPWQPPVVPVIVERAYRPAAPYEAGARRAVALRSSRGKRVRSPCHGAVTFRGSVARRPPAITLNCGALRATLTGLVAAPGRGVRVRAGATIGSAAGNAIRLSARRPDGAYLDPVPLLATIRQRMPPAVAGRTRRSQKGGQRPGLFDQRSHRPARIADRALASTDQGRAAGWTAGAPGGARDAGRSLVSRGGGEPVDGILVAGGGGLLAVGWGAMAVQRRRGRSRHARITAQARLVGSRQ